MPRSPRPTALITILILLCAALAWLLGAGCGRGKSDVIARVNQETITERDLWESLEKADNGEAGRRALDALITHQLIRQEAQSRNIVVTRQELDARLEALKDYLLAASGKHFDEWLADSGQTEEDILDRLSLQMQTARLVFTEDDVEKFFEENQERLKELPHNNESVIFRAIVVASEEEAQAVRNELLADSTDGKVSSEKFARIAEERTLDHTGRHRGGMAGWLVKGKTSSPEIEEVLFELEPGEVSEPIREPIPEGEEGEAAEGKQPLPAWRIFMVEKHVTPGEITLERNADIIEDWMLGQPQYQFQLQQFVNDLKAKADIQILSPRYRVLDEAYRVGREARQRRLAEPTELRPPVPALPEGVEPPAAEAPPAEEPE